jgi:hypothetical protein
MANQVWLSASTLSEAPAVPDRQLEDIAGAHRQGRDSKFWPVIRRNVRRVSVRLRHLLAVLLPQVHALDFEGGGGFDLS